MPLPIIQTLGKEERNEIVRILNKPERLIESEVAHIKARAAYLTDEEKKRMGIPLEEEVVEEPKKVAKKVAKKATKKK